MGGAHPDRGARTPSHPCRGADFSRSHQPGVTRYARSPRAIFLARLRRAGAVFRTHVFAARIVGAKHPMKCLEAPFQSQSCGAAFVEQVVLAVARIESVGAIGSGTDQGVIIVAAAQVHS